MGIDFRELNKLMEKGYREGYSRNLFIKFLKTAEKYYINECDDSIRRGIFIDEIAIVLRCDWKNVNWSDAENVIETFPYSKKITYPYSREQMVKSIIKRFPPGIEETEKKSKEIAKGAIKLKKEKLKLKENSPEWQKAEDETIPHLTARQIYLYGLEIKSFDIKKLFDELLKKDKGGSLIFDAGLNWKWFDYKRGLEAIKNARDGKYFYDAAIRHWPAGIKEVEEKNKEIRDKATKLPVKKLKLENWSDGTDRSKGSNQVSDPGNSYGQYEIDDIIQPPHRLKKKKGKKVKLPHPPIEYPPKNYMEDKKLNLYGYSYVLESIKWALKSYPINPWNAIFGVVEGNMRYLETKQADKIYNIIKKIKNTDKENIKESLLRKLKDYAHPIASAEEQSKEIRDKAIKLPTKKLKLEAIEILEGWASGTNQNSGKRYNSDEEDDEDEFEKLSRELYYQSNIKPYRKRKKIGGDIPEVKGKDRKRKRGKEIYKDELIGKQPKKIKLENFMELM